MPPLLAENSGCKAQRGGAGGAMFKRCNKVNAVFEGQPEGLVPVFVHFVVARRSHAALHHRNHSSRLERHKNGHQRGHE